MAVIREYTTTYSPLIVGVLACTWLAVAIRAWRYSLILDALLTVLFLVRPSFGVLVIGVTLTAWRYVPWLACDIADLVQAEESTGLTRAFWRFVLVGWESEGAQALNAPRAATGKTVALTPPTMPLRSMLAYINSQPDRVPHLAIIGPSGSGKTTLATVVLSDRPGLVIVLTAKEGDTWGGLPYVGIDDDATYKTAQETFEGLDQEVKARLLQTKHGQAAAEWLTVVLDDFSTLQNECPIAPSVVKLVARLGRSLRVRLIMLSDSALVKAIGLEGEGETRSNFAFVRLERGHGAMLEIEGMQRPVDIRGADRIAVDLSNRSWSVPVPVGVPISAGNGTGTGNGAGNEVSIEVLRALRSAGWTREQARARGLNFRDSKWTEAA